jgi:quercetin 2,3-dioxygenase
MITLRRAVERGHATHGWLDSYHSFSFADYHDARHMAFRSLRVINEDRVQPGEGFGTHSHRDFEIISYVISGALEHKDSMGTKAVMRAGDIQRISAGTGISHSEYNHSRSEILHFLQIWITPSRRGVQPNYAEHSFGDPPRQGLTLACSGDGRDGSVVINQDADLFIGRIDATETITHLMRAQRFAWVQLISGVLNVNGQELTPGDGASLQDEPALELLSKAEAHFLLFDLN